MTELISDEKLMLRYQKGDALAFDELYARHKDSIYRYLLRQCNDQAVAEELYQDVWLKLIHARKRYQPKAKFSTYLFRIAHNRLIDHYRKSSRIEWESYQEQLPSAEVDTVTLPKPDEKLELEQIKRQFLSALSALPAAQREVVLLQAEAGMSLEQIAELCGCGRETVKSRLRYAMNKLRHPLEALA